MCVAVTVTTDTGTLDATISFSFVWSIFFSTLLLPGPQGHLSARWTGTENKTYRSRHRFNSWKKRKRKKERKRIRMYVLTLITACVNERFKMHFCERDRAWGIPRRRERERQLDSWQQCEINNSTFKINRHALTDAPTFARRFSPLSFHRNQPAPKQCTCPRYFTKVARARSYPPLHFFCGLTSQPFRYVER